jgi:hypothetical protein
MIYAAESYAQLAKDLLGNCCHFDDRISWLSFGVKTLSIGFKLFLIYRRV